MNGSDPSLWTTDGFRSLYVQKLLERTIIRGEIEEPSTIPRRIVQYWDDPKHVPDDVLDCMRSWRSLERDGFSLSLFNDISGRLFIEEHFGSLYCEGFDKCYHPAMRCDYFRLCYIYLEGGFYVDADEVYNGRGCSSLYRNNRLKLQPMCYDLASESMIDLCPFVNTSLISGDRIYYFNNNPIVAPSNHPIIHLALERATHLLLSGAADQGIQSTTGPGNLTASVVRHALATDDVEGNYDFSIIPNWTAISTCRWQLDYRQDARNWRFGIPIKGRRSDS